MSDKSGRFPFLVFNKGHSHDRMSSNNHQVSCFIGFPFILAHTYETLPLCPSIGYEYFLLNLFLFPLSNRARKSTHTHKSKIILKRFT